MGGAVGGLGGGWRNSVYTCTVLQPLHESNIFQGWEDSDSCSHWNYTNV